MRTGKYGGTVQTWTCFPLNLYAAPYRYPSEFSFDKQLSCSKKMNNISLNQPKTHCWCWTKLSKHTVRLIDRVRSHWAFSAEPLKRLVLPLVSTQLHVSCWRRSVLQTDSGLRLCQQVQKKPPKTGANSSIILTTDDSRIGQLTNLSLINDNNTLVWLFSANSGCHQIHF